MSVTYCRLIKQIIGVVFILVRSGQLFSYFTGFVIWKCRMSLNVFTQGLDFLYFVVIYLNYVLIKLAHVMRPQFLTNS